MTDIPDFLKIPQAVRDAAWKGRKLTKPSRVPFKFTRNEDAQTKAFRRQLEREAEAKKQARFAMLKEKRAAERRQRR